MLLIILMLGMQAAMPEPCAIENGASAAPGWRATCDAAIAAETDPKRKSVLLAHSGFGYNEANDMFHARPALEQAVRLDPQNVGAQHELGYTANAFGDYAQGERALDAEIALSPDSAGAYSERAFSRHYLGDLAGALADRDREVALRPGAPGPLVARAIAARWLGRFDQVRADLDAAAALATTQGDAGATRQIEHERGLLALWTARSGSGDAAAACVMAKDDAGFRQPGFIGDCTAAFFAETDPAKRAELLTTRSLAWLSAAQDEYASTDDRAIAAALDPGNADTHANLAFAYLSVHRSWAAKREFDRALAIKPSWAALAGRASANYNLHDAEHAFADAKRSFEIHPNEIALTVLGDLAKDRGDVKSAKLYWMGAWHLGDRGDELIERLKSIGVDHPESEPAGGKQGHS